MGKVELTVLRLAVYEMKYDDSVPEKVAINEAVELARRFGQDGAPAFVNAILSRFTREGEKKYEQQKALKTEKKEEEAAPDRNRPRNGGAQVHIVHARKQR